MQDIYTYTHIQAILSMPYILYGLVHFVVVVPPLHHISSRYGTGAKYDDLPDAIGERSKLHECLINTANHNNTISSLFHVTYRYVAFLTVCVANIQYATK
jgi:hypothetical protein